MTTASIVQRVWNYCNTLRDDGVSYGDYVEQLTYPLFLNIAEEIVEILEAGLSSFKQITDNPNGNSKK
jgi:hypothetical protein